MSTTYHEGPDRPINLGTAERTISALIGSFLITRFIRRHTAETLLAAAGGYLLYRALTGRCAIYGLAENTPRNVNVRTSVVVGKSRREVYANWKNLERLPHFMKHLGSVSKLDKRRSLWKIDAPKGMPTVEWTAEIVKDQENEEISWHSLPGSTIDNAGKVNFSDTPSGGTRIDVALSYRAPFGKVGEELGWLLNGIFRRKVEEDIRGFKKYVEDNGLS